MNKQSKRTLRAGIVLLVLLGGSAVVYLNWVYSSSKSNRAQITMTSYAVGTEYAGIITKQYVVAGDTVHQGDPLFKLKSDDLTEQIKSGRTSASSLTYPIGTDGQMLITASKDGTVYHIDAAQGSFVVADKQLATVSDTATVGVTADFSLSKAELAHLSPNAPIIVNLPSRGHVNGRITSVIQSSQGGKQVTTIQASLPAGSLNTITTAGTQVDASLVLDQSTFYSRLLGVTQALLSRWF